MHQAGASFHTLRLDKFVGALPIKVVIWHRQNGLFATIGVHDFEFRRYAAVVRVGHQVVNFCRSVELVVRHFLVARRIGWDVNHWIDDHVLAIEVLWLLLMKVQADF